MRAEMKEKEKEIRDASGGGRSGSKNSSEAIAEAKAEIRERYTKKIDALFSGELDISTIEGVDDTTDLKDDKVAEAEKDLEVLENATNGGTGETVDANKLLNKSDTSTTDSQITSNGGMDVVASQNDQKLSNAEKVREISSNPANEIEVIPTSTSSGNNQETAGGQQSADSGEASSIPALKTSNDSNEYRMLFSHTYQQG